MKKLRNIFTSYILCVLQITTKLLRITTTLLITNYDEVLLQITTAFVLRIATRLLQVTTEHLFHILRNH